MTTQTTIDWDALRRRTREGTKEMSKDELEAIFKDRAALLAKRTETESERHGTPMFRFSVGRANFAVDLGFVRSIMAPRWTTTIPGAPSHLAEVAHVNGRIISLLRIDVYMAIGKGDTTPDRYLLLEHQGKRLGLGTTRLIGIEELDLEELVPAGQTSGGELLRGVASDMTLVLDGARVIGDLCVELGRAEQG